MQIFVCICMPFLNILFYNSDINKHKHFYHVLFDFWITKEDIKKYLNSKIPSFVWRIWKWKEKRTQNHGYGATLKKMKLVEKRQSQHATPDHANVAVLR